MQLYVLLLRVVTLVASQSVLERVLAPSRCQRRAKPLGVLAGVTITPCDSERPKKHRAPGEGGSRAEATREENEPRLGAISVNVVARRSVGLCGGGAADDDDAFQSE